MRQRPASRLPVMLRSVIVLLTVATLALSFAMSTPKSALAGGTIGIDTYPNPTGNAPVFPNASVCSTSITPDNSWACFVDSLAKLDFDHRNEGLPAVSLPANFRSMPEDEQMMILINEERIQRGILPVAAVTNELDQASVGPNNQLTDPSFPNNYPLTNGGSIAAAGMSNVIDAVRNWVYDDDYPIDTDPTCTATNQAGCWGHREVILTNYGCNPTCTMGSASVTAASGFPVPGQIYRALMADDNTGGALPSLTYLYYWSQISPTLLPAPTITSLSTQSVPLNGGTEITVTGTNLSGALMVMVGNQVVEAVSNDSSTSLSFQAPDQTGTGTQAVTVYTLGGQSQPGPASSINYYDPGNLTSMSDPPSSLMAQIGTISGSATLDLYGTMPIRPTSPEPNGMLFTIEPSGASWQANLAPNGSFAFDFPWFVETLQALGSTPTSVNVTMLYNGSPDSAAVNVPVENMDAVPPPPSNVAASVISSSSAVVSWSPSNPPAADFGDPVGSYTVTATDNTTSSVVGTKTVSGMPPNDSVEFTGLPSGDNYIFSVYASNDFGNSTTVNSAVYSFSGSNYYPVTPFRVADTRAGATDPSTYAGLTPTAGKESLDVKIAGVGSVPSNATAVVINVTATYPTQNGFLTVYPAGTSMPTTSTLNFVAGEYAVANMVEIPLGANGSITVTNFMGSTDFIVDVEGYDAAPSNSTPNEGLFNPVTPFRVVDTRSGATDPSTYAGETLSSGQVGTYKVTGIGSGLDSIPATNVAAVVLNVTATNTTGIGFATAFPTNSTNTPPGSSTLNFSPFQTVPNRVIVPIGLNGDISIFVKNSSADFVIDVSGWFTGSSGGSGDHFYSVLPTRIADSRSASGFQDQGSPLSGGSPIGLGTPDSVNVVMAESDDVPSSAVAVVANLTVTDSLYPGFLTAWPQGVSAPGSSDVNWAPGETVPNAAIVPLGTSSNAGHISVAANTLCDFIVDVTGYYGP